jgi:hypothetical protein
MSTIECSLPFPFRVNRFEHLLWRRHSRQRRASKHRDRIGMLQQVPKANPRIGLDLPRLRDPQSRIVHLWLVELIAREVTHFDWRAHARAEQT